MNKTTNSSATASLVEPQTPKKEFLISKNNVKSSFKQPNVDNPIRVRITNITEFGLVTIVFNQRLQVEDKYLIVHFEQLSIEAGIGFTWKLINSTDL